MKREPIRKDTAEAWRAAQRRRSADIAALFEKQRPKTGIMPARRLLAIPTVFASLVVAAAVWTVAGQPMHKHAKQANRPAFDQAQSSPVAR
jgi:cytochrome c-type biogenesis protein CcmH/NrfG